MTGVVAPEEGGFRRRVVRGGGGGTAMGKRVVPVAVWAGEGEHGVALDEAKLMGSTGRPEGGCRRRRVLVKVAAGDGEERGLRRLWWRISERVLGDAFLVVRGSW